MKEIEVLIEVVSSKEIALEKLSFLSFIEKKKVFDIYYMDPQRVDLQPDAHGRLSRSFRVRDKEGEISMTYKKDYFNEQGKWEYSDEHEVRVSDLKVAQEIIHDLGLRELVKVENTKYMYKNKDYEIVLEDVEGLGLFLEVELRYQVRENETIQEKERIRLFIASLGIETGEECNSGKPELILGKKV